MVDLHTSVRTSSLWMMIRLGISLTVGAFVTTYIVRSLTVKDYGIYAVLYSLISYVSVIGSLGISSVLQRFIPEALQHREYALLKYLVSRGLILRILLSAATVGVILLFHDPVGRLLKVEGFIDYFSIFAWGIVLLLEANLLTAVLHSLFLHKYSVIASTLYFVFRGGSVSLLLRLGYGIYGLLWAEVVAWGLWVFLQWGFYYFKFMRLHTDSERKALPLRRYVRYGSLSLFNELGSSVFSVSTDFFIITAVLGPGAVALYAFADRVIKLFTHCMPHIALSEVIRPTFFTKYAESGNNQHLIDMFNLLVKIGAFFVFPLAAGLFVLGDPMITLVFRPEYLAARPILWLLLFFTALNVFVSPMALTLQAIEQVQITLYSRIFAIYNLIVELLVIKHFGVMGVVAVTCSAVLMKNLFLTITSRNMSGRVWTGVDYSQRLSMRRRWRCSSGPFVPLCIVSFHWRRWPLPA